MRKSTRILLVAVLFFSTVFHLTPVLGQEVQGETGFHSDWWDSPNGDLGQQYYIPMIARVDYRDLSFRVVAGRAYTTFDSSTSHNPSLGAFLDTRVNLSYQIVEKWPIDVLFAIDINLPTGTRELTREELALIMDPDLISIIDFGEGFNFNPSVVISRQWGENLLTGIGVGFNLRSRYQFSTEVLDYSPGDIFSVVPEVRYDFTDRWQGRLYGNFTAYGMSKTYSQDFVQQGNFFLIGAGITYTRAGWAAGVSLFGILRAKDKWYQSPDQDVPLTYSFVQGNEVVSDLTFNYFLDDKTTLKSLLRYLWMSSNSQPFESPLYWGERHYFALKLGLARKLTANVEAECAFKGLTMHDDPNWYHVGQERSFRGAAAELKITGFF